MPADAGLKARRRPMPAGPTARRRPVSALIATCTVLSVAACGALPPQAPVPAASLVSRALTTIAASCGESYRLAEFTPRPDLSGLEATASQSARQLERIRVRHPQWVYQGETLTQIAGASLEYLNACSLPGAARILRAG